MITIDLEDTYAPHYVSEDLMTFTFTSILSDATAIELYVLIREHPDPLLSGVYNLSFGPLGENDQIDDEIILNHQNINRVISTAFLFAITFLENYSHKNFHIGVDGSTDVRDYLYHRMFKYNYDSLSETIVIVGVDWYAKLLRNGKDIERDSFERPLFKPIPEPFDVDRKSSDLYRYYMFTLKD